MYPELFDAHGFICMMHRMAPDTVVSGIVFYDSCVLIHGIDYIIYISRFSSPIETILEKKNEIIFWISPYIKFLLTISPRSPVLILDLLCFSSNFVQVFYFSNLSGQAKFIWLLRKANNYHQKLTKIIKKQYSKRKHVAL